MEVTYGNYKEKLGLAIRQKREDKGLSREGLASMIEGVCTQTIMRMESGDYPYKDMSLHSIQVVCAELGLSVKLTLGGVL